MTKSVREKLDKLPVISKVDFDEIISVMEISFEEIEYLLKFLKKQEEEEDFSSSEEDCSSEEEYS